MSDDEPDAKKYLHPGFLKQIDDTDIIWRLTLAGGLSYEVRIISYINTARGVPITLYVHSGEDSFEIPWTAIQTIQKVVNNG